MKNTIIEIKAIISALTILMVAANRSSAQTNTEALKFSNEIESKISDFEINASDIETNESILDSQKEMDKDMGGAQNSIEGAVVMLEFSQVNIGREERTLLWFEVLGAIDRRLGKITYTDISGHIRPPVGYKGKMGIDGMEMPDTNDVIDYEYYMAARRANKKKAMNGIFQNTLHSDNESLATPYAEKFFRSSYLSEADKREFEDLLDSSKLSNARKKALSVIVGRGH